MGKLLNMHYTIFTFLLLTLFPVGARAADAITYKKNVCVETILDDMYDLISRCEDSLPLWVNYNGAEFIIVSMDGWCMPKGYQWEIIDHPIRRYNFAPFTAKYNYIIEYMTDKLHTNEVYMIFPSCDIRNNSLINNVEIRHATITNNGTLEYTPIIWSRTIYCYSCETNSWDFQIREYGNGN